MKILNCFICDEPLDEHNSSEEHIILNAIGGHLKPKILCKTCNSEHFSRCDAMLASQLHPLSSHLQVKRDRGQVPILKGLIDENGLKYNLIEGYEPLMQNFHITKLKDEVDIQAPNKKLLLHALKKLKRTYPEIDIGEIMEKANATRHNVGLLNFNLTFGGPLTSMSILKSIVGFYIYSELDKKHIESKIIMLKEKKIENISAFMVHYYPSNSPYLIEENEVCHVLHLQGNAETGLLLGYVEFFSSYSLLIVLSNDYRGNNFQKSYFYDLISQRKVAKEIYFNINDSNLKQFFKVQSSSSLEILEKRLERVIDVGNSKIHNPRAIKEILEKSFE